MQVLPINNISTPTISPSSSVGAVSSSSRDIASSTLTPSVTVSLSNSNKAEAITNIAVPPVYTRVSVGATTTNQLSPSRSAAERPIAGVNSDQEEVSEVDLAGRSTISDGSVAEGDERSAGEQRDDEPIDEVQARASAEQNITQGQLTEEQRELVQALQARDQEVRAHEQAHKSVGGSLAGPVSLSYQTGPNGQRYAVGGEVPIDVSIVNGDPAATIRKMNIVKAAATAPVDPSAQDQRVAASASIILAQAIKDLSAENVASQREQASKGSSDSDSDSVSSEKNTLNNAEVRTNFKSEYEDVIAPLESKSVQI
ncbi:MAG: hypothetical protein ACJASG_002013, partial [Oleiphilaceae bacterium]